MSTAALERLADVLARENAALKRMDFSAAVALVPEKEAALVAITRDASGPAAGALLPAGLALRGLAEENRVLLARAIEVQTRIVRMVAKAIVPQRDGARYNRPNAWKTPQRTVAMAVSKSV